MEKVLAIAPYSYLPFFSGGQKFIAQFFEWLATRTELTVITVSENDLSLAKNYRILPLLKKSFSRYIDRSLVPKAVALVQEGKYDTLICEHPYFAWLCFAVRKRTGINVIIHTHNIEYQRFRSTGKWWWPVLKKYEQKSFKKADGIFFITPEDRQFAITEWGIQPSKCLNLPFGIELDQYPTDRDECKQAIHHQYQIPVNEKLLLFNGLLNYKPNIDALQVILEKINLLLLAQNDFKYKIIVCGKNMPDEFDELKSYRDKNIVYAGFVDDITIYLKAADVFLNPVLSGGGVKTKMVEAIAYGSTVVSTQTGSIGIDKEACGEKLKTIADQDWDNFAKQIVEEAGKQTITPGLYYEIYYWGNIIEKVIAFNLKN